MRRKPGPRDQRLEDGTGGLALFARGECNPAARFLEPLPLPGQTFAKRYPRLPTQSLAGEVDGGARMTGVAWRGGKVKPPDLDPADVLEGVGDPIYGNPAAAGEIDDLADPGGGG